MKEILSSISSAMKERISSPLLGYPTNQILTIEITNIESGFYKQIGSSNLFKQKIEGKVEIID
jgi:hypothetical protein